MQIASLSLMSLLLAVAGIFHLISPEGFMAILPPWVPLKRELVLATGVLELMFIPGLWIDKIRKLNGRLLALYFASLLPIHVYMAIEEIPLGSFGESWMLWLRVFLQFPLILWALSTSRDRRKESICSVHTFQRRNEFEGRPPGYEATTDIGKFYEVEFVLGRCTRCEQWLLSCWVPAVANGSEEVISEDLVRALDECAHDKTKKNKILSTIYDTL